MQNPFRYFNSPLAIIRLAVMMYVRFPLSLRQVEDVLCERGIDICHETVRFWWNRFGPLFAAEIRKRRIHLHSHSNWRWHLDEVSGRISGETHYLWRAVDHEGEGLCHVVGVPAGAPRLPWTRKSSTSPSLSTARQSQYLPPRIEIDISSRCQ